MSLRQIFVWNARACYKKNLMEIRLVVSSLYPLFYTSIYPYVAKIILKGMNDGKLFLVKIYGLLHPECCFLSLKRLEEEGWENPSALVCQCALNGNIVQGKTSGWMDERTDEVGRKRGESWKVKRKSTKTSQEWMCLVVGGGSCGSTS